MKPAAIANGYMAILAAISPNLMAMGNDDPLMTKVIIERLEAGIDNRDIPQWLEVTGWAGYDLNKLWLKSSIERTDSETESGDIELLYGRAIAPYWDFQLGWRRDFQPTPTRDWLAIGFQGLAPYFFEVDSTLYLGSSNRSALEIEVEYELMLTQRWVLSPRTEILLNGQNDNRTATGSGLSSLEAGLRLRYEIRREVAPYLGIHWERAYGNTADLRQEEGEKTSEVHVVVGIRAWF